MFLNWTLLGKSAATSIEFVQMVLLCIIAKCITYKNFQKLFSILFMLHFTANTSLFNLFSF